LNSQESDIGPAKAWQAVMTEAPAPDRIELLRKSRETSVFRLRVGSTTIIAKRCPAATGRIEKKVYEAILSTAAVSAPRFYGAMFEARNEKCWLFVEEVRGAAYRPDRAADRAHAARWLAALHSSVRNPTTDPQLAERRPNHYAQMLQRVRDSLAGLVRARKYPAGHIFTAMLAHCDTLQRHWDELQLACDLGPDTLVHGDLVAHNAVIVSTLEGPAFMAFDWEKAGWGTPAEDLANVDLRTYRNSLGRLWPEIGKEELERIAGAGKVFRCLVYLEWLGPDLEHDHAGTEEPLSQCRYWLDGLLERRPWLI